MPAEKPYWPPYRRPGQPLPEKAVTRAEIAEHLGISRISVDWMARRGQLPPVIGHRTLSKREGGNGKPIKLYSLKRVCEMRGKMDV